MWIISFDLKSKPATDIKAYSQICNRLAENNFAPLQGSVYYSVLGLNNTYKAIESVKRIKGIKKCVKNFQVFQLMDGSDFTPVMLNNKPIKV